MERIRVTRIDVSPRRRHEHRVATRSVDYARLRTLDRLTVDESGARRVVAVVCEQAGVPVPELRFHARRSPFTGATEAPRHRVAALAARGGFEMPDRIGRAPEHGAVRLGRTTTLMTIAHELGHHLVNHLDPVGTATHGNVWVRRFDQAAAVIDRLVDS